jgi:phosphonoacetate hydrolase
MIELSGRRYALPRHKTAVFCVDGCAPEYLDLALTDGLMPRLRAALDAGGHYVRGQAQIPSFTNPNNLSIVTGQPTRVHGISGNHYFDRELGREVAMNDPRFLRAPTIFERLGDAGVRTLSITAKDKLRPLLGARLNPGPPPLALSAEKAHEQAIAELGLERATLAVGRPNPSIYDWEISHYAMELGLALHDKLDVRFLYVSLTDYVQHLEPPRGPLANRFYARFDELLGAYLDQGFRCSITADHGMNDKWSPDTGAPNVIYIEELLSRSGVSAHAVLPITDPYVAHHGSLGSYAMVYVAPSDVEAGLRVLEGTEGVHVALRRDDAAQRFELPEDRIGDLIVLGDQRTVFGKRRQDHDLSALEHRPGAGAHTSRLRSHGGLYEAVVPLIVCHPLTGPLRERVARDDGTLTNADICDLALNGQA